MDKRALEKTMADLSRHLAQREFADIEEVNRFLAGLMAESGDGIPAKPAGTPLEEAQDLMYEAWDATGTDRAQLARKALEISPDCADAYVLLAEEKARTVEEARDFFAQGVAAGERALGADVLKEDAGHFWGLLETRPYMRAREGLAHCLWELGERQKAIAHYKEMLRLNPNDNQGMRYVLLDCLLAARRDEEAGALLADYEDDGSAAWEYNRTLWTFRRQGDGTESRRCLKEALRQNRHVPAYLLGRERLPDRLPDFVGFGDESEAVSYVAGALDNWRATDGALSWLAGMK
jgi:tetratricopeptide (TPR) repeat protein